MDKILIINEKREVGTDMLTASLIDDKALTAKSKDYWQTLGKKQGFIEGDKYLITWATGHFYRLQVPKEVNPNYALFKYLKTDEEYKQKDLIKAKIVLDDDPDIYFDKGRKDFVAFKMRQYKHVIEQVKRKDIKEIWLWADPDAEGERICQDIIRFAKDKVTVPIYRVWNAGSNKVAKAVEDAIGKKTLWTDSTNANLYDSAVARLSADNLVGMKITKVQTEKYSGNGVLNTGRIKGPIISLLCKNEEEIKNFKPKTYYIINGVFKNIKFNHYYYKEETDEKGKTSKVKEYRYYRKSERDETMSIIDKNKKTGIVEIYEETVCKTTKRPLPFSTSDFQTAFMSLTKVNLDEANRTIEYLREEGFTTYPRTDGNYYDTKDLPEVEEALETCKEVYKEVADLKDFKISSLKASKSVFIINDKEAAKQNHTPLCVTGKVPTKKDFDNWKSVTYKDVRLKYVEAAYHLIAKRFFAAFFPDDEFVKQNITIDIEGRKFDTSGDKPTQQGWRTVTGDLKKDTSIPIQLKKGDKLTFDKIEEQEKLTEPPKPYTQGSLIKTLVNISSTFEDEIEEETDTDRIKHLKTLKKLLVECKGIGTEATRESIIKDLIEGDFIEVNKKTNVITVKKLGWFIYGVLPEYMKKIETTAQWEFKLEQIRKGALSAKDFIEEVDKICMEIMIPDILLKSKSYSKEKIMSTICPKCKSGNVVIGDKVAKCSEQKWNKDTSSIEGCEFSVFLDQTKFLDKKLTEGEIVTLCEGGQVEGKDGNKLELDLDSKYCTKIIWGKSGGGAKGEDLKLECPVCKKGTIIYGDKTASCSEQKWSKDAGVTGCKFALFLESKPLGSKITKTQIKDLIKGKAVEGKDGNKLELDLSNQYFTKVTWGNKK